MSAKDHPSSTGLKKTDSILIEPSKNKFKFTSENIFKSINVLVTTILVFCIRGFMQFRDHCQSQGYYVFATESLIWVAVGFFSIWAIKYSYFHYMRKPIYAIIKPEFEGETRNRKTRFVLKLSYDCFFYTFTTIVSFLFFRQEYWFPSVVGGQGSCSALYKDYPNWPPQKRTQLEIYFLFQLGVHAFSVFEMVVLKSRLDKFHEFLLHHMIAVSLILFSIMSNQTVAGAMILIVHDMSDIPMSGAKAFIETKYASKVINAALYVILLSVWVYCRILVYPLCLLANVWVNTPLERDEWHIISFEYKYLLSMACILELMHIYWTYYVLVTGMNTLRKKKMVNTHEKNSIE